MAATRSARRTLTSLSNTYKVVFDLVGVKMMAGPLGELEQLLLLALLHREGEASGSELRQELEERIGRTVMPGAVYTIMERMVERSLVTSFTGDSAPERGGRRRKYYRIRRAGERALAESYQQVQGMAAGLDKRLRRLMQNP